MKISDWFKSLFGQANKENKTLTVIRSNGIVKVYKDGELVESKPARPDQVVITQCNGSVIITKDIDDSSTVKLNTRKQ